MIIYLCFSDNGLGDTQDEGPTKVKADRPTLGFRLEHSDHVSDYDKGLERDLLLPVRKLLKIAEIFGVINVQAPTIVNWN